MGYADIGPFGADYPTPNLDRMAEGGMKFTQFLVSAAVCSASRASLLTGCLNQRLGIPGAYSPKSPNGLNPDEITLAELVKQRDYATACIGKWHLGLHPKFLPANQGFDYYFGLPYSNDMWPWHPRYHGLAPDDPKRTEVYPPLPLVENTEVIDPEVTAEEQTMLTTWYTEKAVQFIEENRHKPFLVYLPHSMVHVPLFVSDKFKGKSGLGLYADTVMELDWSLGQILDTLEKYRLEKDTLVIFTSDNGPWASYGEHGGSADPLRGFKHTAWEGGLREPTLFWWPGKIPPRRRLPRIRLHHRYLPHRGQAPGSRPAPTQDRRQGYQSPHVWPTRGRISPPILSPFPRRSVGRDQEWEVETGFPSQIQRPQRPARWKRRLARSIRPEHG